MTAQDYGVSFPYGATDPPYSASRPHRGNDRACPSGTPILVGGIQIGLVGATGLATGPHLHTQAGTDIDCQNTFNPTPLEFQPGIVVRAGVGSQWGNYVTVRTLNGNYITYAHMSRIDVSVGQELNNNVSPEEKADYLKFKEEFARLRYLLSGRPANKISQQERRLRLDMNFEQINKALADGGLNIIEPAELLNEIESLKKDAKVLPPGKYIVEE